MRYKYIHLSKVFIWIGIIIMFSLKGINLYPIPQSILGGVITSTIILVVFEINKRWLFPKYYTAHHTYLFFVFNIALTLAFAFLQTTLNTHLIFPYRLFEPPIQMSKGLHFFPSFVIVLLGNVIGMAFLFTNALKKQAEKEKLLKEDKLGTELKLLKAQINPHFMFNALNNIYSLAYTKSEKTADSVLKLSEMLRYVLDECQQEHVKLSSEISYISSYIAFQQMKSEHAQKIRFNYNSVVGDELISSMLFIPFIENSFKYSKIVDDPNAWVDIDLIKTDSGIDFTLKNSIPIEGKPKRGSGMGISNVRVRLDLMYPEGYQLTINEYDSSYSINLKLDLK